MVKNIPSRNFARILMLMTPSKVGGFPVVLLKLHVARTVDVSYT
jgi:hypothetical protein